MVDRIFNSENKSLDSTLRCTGEKVILPTLKMCFPPLDLVYFCFCFYLHTAVIQTFSTTTLVRLVCNVRDDKSNNNFNFPFEIETKENEFNTCFHWPNNEDKVNPI